MEPVERRELAWLPVNGAGVVVLGLPNYSGLWGYLRMRSTMKDYLQRVVGEGDAIIVRIPSHVATSVETVVKLRRQPYGAEVVGDVNAAFSPESTGHVLRPLLRYFGVWTVQRQCLNACAISYVSEKSLQTLYPHSPQAFATHYSSIDLPDEEIATSPKVFNDKEVKIISVGSMALKYKRFDVLIEAVADCVASGMNISLLLVGDGRHRDFFEEKAAILGNRVKFLGELPGSSAVQEQLRQADLFVLPSASEGLPRVVIEAMAVGLPCIATSVGGTTELLRREELVPPGDPRSLAQKIREVAGSRERMQFLAVQNLQKAHQYKRSVLSERRTNMYKQLKECTAKWIAHNEYKTSF